MTKIFINENRERSALKSSRPIGYDWYIVESVVESSADRYLHNDGVWRYTTKFGNIFSGYYPSQQAAEDMAKSMGLKYTVR